VVDDLPDERAELQHLLADQPDLRLVAAVATPESALAVLDGERIDVAIVNYRLGSRTGLRLTRKFKRSAQPPAVLIYGASTDLWISAAAIVAQADALLDKGLRQSRLCGALRGLARGQRLLPPVAPAFARTLRGHLCLEEQLIFGMLLAGIDLTQIARALAISVSALEAHLSAMLGKLELLHAERLQPREAPS
jgi:DNA-binding NarL/FixJ family response regulator